MAGDGAGPLGVIVGVGPGRVSAQGVENGKAAKGQHFPDDESDDRYEKGTEHSQPEPAQPLMSGKKIADQSVGCKAHACRDEDAAGGPGQTSQPTHAAGRWCDQFGLVLGLKGDFDDLGAVGREGAGHAGALSSRLVLGDGMGNGALHAIQSPMR